MRKIVFVLFLLSGIFSAEAQTSANDYRLAMQYYNEQDYEKAVVLFEKLFDNTRNKVYFSYYTNCLIFLKEFDKAERETKKQIKRNPDQVAYRVDLGYIYKIQNEKEKAETEFENAVNLLDGKRYSTIDLANSFLQRHEYDWAEKTYLVARENNQEYMYRYELASVYSMDRNYEKMVAEYVDLIMEDEIQLSNVQNRLQYYITSSTHENVDEVLRKYVLRKLQQNPQKYILNELLIWLFVQQKNFSAALTQEIAIDKRFDLKGQRVLMNGDLALSNEDYSAAKASYSYVLTLGKEEFFYTKAKVKLLNTKFEELQLQQPPDTIAFKQLEQEYLAALNDLGQNKKTVGLLKDLAHIQAFYLNKTQHALDLLDYASGVPGVTPQLAAECKMEMADIYMLQNEVYEAALIYARLDKDNSENPIGHEAKFRKARLAFYIGDFRWAEAQLDVLKAATSKLISNDAFRLSNLIKNNMSDDSINVALKIYARAGLFILQNKTGDALLSLDTLINTYAASAVVDDAYYLRADILHKLYKYEQEAENLNFIIDNYYYDLLADDAVFRLAVLYEEKLYNPDKAMELYEQIIIDFPGSIYVSEARKNFRRLRGDNI